MPFLREIIENIRLADWQSFTEEAAACHIFMAFTKCEESKRACYKILTEMPHGDTQLLMAKIQAIEAFPDNKAHSVKPINLRDDDKIRQSCTAYKFRWHSVTECWGKCQHCGKYGHKSNLCRHKPDQPESEPAKKASVDGKSKSKGNYYETWRLASMWDKTAPMST